MKITLNIDDALLERVMISTGANTKTDAIHMALSEMDRRAKLIAVLGEDLGLTPDELGKAFDPASDPMISRKAYSIEESLTLKVAEEPPISDL